MPYPIQLGPVTDRLRNFFRLRGKTTFMLDEVVVPVTVVQDVTRGPYQAGVTPAAGSFGIILDGGLTTQMVIVLDVSQGALIALPTSFTSQSFTITGITLQNRADYNPIQQPATQGTFSVNLINRSVPEALQIIQPAVQNQRLISIQGNDGRLTVPVEMFVFLGGVASSGKDRIFSGALGPFDLAGAKSVANTLVTFAPDPPVTIDRNGAVLLNIPPWGGDATGQVVEVSIRGFFQQQIA